MTMMLKRSASMSISSLLRQSVVEHTLKRVAQKSSVYDYNKHNGENNDMIVPRVVTYTSGSPRD